MEESEVAVMSTVIAQQTIVTPKRGHTVLFWPECGPPRAINHGKERFVVTRTMLGNLDSGKFLEIMDSKGSKSKWHPAHMLDEVPS